MASIRNFCSGEVSCEKLEHENDVELLSDSCANDSYGCHGCYIGGHIDDGYAGLILFWSEPVHRVDTEDKPWSPSLPAC